MRRSQEPKTSNPSKLFSGRERLEAAAEGAHNAKSAQVNRLKSKPAQFFKQILGFKPFKYQKELIELFENKQFIAARWCRQSGKSFTISALLLNYALNHPDSYIAVVGPSWRQTKLNIRRISFFLRKLNDPGVKAQKTRISFPNGSVIEAFPNNPDTIRGPTLNLVWLDEANFVSGDTDLYDAILFTLGTTNGKLVCTSTPWSSDSLFWKMCNHRDFDDFARHHVTWQEAQEPHGPLKKGILDKIRKQFGEDPARWRREMEAEWAEDQDVWLSQSLITKCIGANIDLYTWDSAHHGNFYAGLDLGKHDDYSALTVAEKVEDVFLLRLLKIFPLETSYASVIGFVKALQDRWGGFERLRADKTGVGDYVVEDMKNGGIENCEGVVFTLPRKQEMASLMKQRMIEGRYKFPYFTWEKPYRSEYAAELNTERFQLRKDGTISFSHPRGTHDDVFWASALALYATVEMAPDPFVAVIQR